MTEQEILKETGINKTKFNYLKTQGLLPMPRSKTKSNRNGGIISLYDETIVEIINAILEYQRIGLSLKEIEINLDLHYEKTYTKIHTGYKRR